MLPKGKVLPSGRMTMFTVHLLHTISFLNISFLVLSLTTAICLRQVLITFTFPTTQAVSHLILPDLRSQPLGI